MRLDLAAYTLSLAGYRDELGYNLVGGTFGEPQTLVLDPSKARIKPLS